MQKSLVRLKCLFFLKSWIDNQFRFRLINEFNEIYQFILLVFFAWAFLNICSLLLIFQAQINVSIDFFRINGFKILIFDVVDFSTAVTWYMEPNWTDNCVNCSDLHIFCSVYRLWVWRTSQQTIWNFSRKPVPMWLVFVTNKSAKNLFNISGEHTTNTRYS